MGTPTSPARHRWLWVGCSALLTGGLLTGCGGEGAAPPPAPPPPVPPPEPEPVRFVLAATYDRLDQAGVVHRFSGGVAAGDADGDGDVDFPAVRQVLLDAGFKGWCTVEQDCDPTLDPDPVGDARGNREYLESIGFN